MHLAVVIAIMNTIVSIITYDRYPRIVKRLLFHLGISFFNKHGEGLVWVRVAREMHSSRLSTGDAVVNMNISTYQ